MTNLFTQTNTSAQTLLFSTDAGANGVLAVSPPFLSGYKPLPNGVAGANRHMVNSDRRGLLFYIFPYLEMSATDRINAYLGSRPAPVASFDVGPYANQLVPFHITANVLEQMYAIPSPLPKALPLYFTVDRISGNPAEDSPSLSLLYKPSGPGELDTRPDLPNNQGLALPIPSETIVDQTVINEGMFVTIPKYKHQAVGDTVYLAVGPFIEEMQVTVLGDLLFALTPAFLAGLPNTDCVSISYEIVDIVQNESGWSSAVVLTLKPTVVLLSAPVVDEADEKNTVDFDALAGNDATVLLTGLFKTNDVVVLSLVVFTLAGDRIERTIRPRMSNSRLLIIPLENHYVQNAIRGSIVLSYTQESAGVTRFSKSYTATVSGLALPAPAPVIEEQEGSELPADTSPAHVRIPKYWPLAVGATVQLFWQVTGANGVVHLYIFGQIINDVSQEIIFTVESEYIDRFAGSPLTALYKIENPGTSVVQSESLQIEIGEVAVVTPTIDSVKDSFGELIPHGTTTFSKSVALMGTASPTRRLTLIDGSSPVTLLTADDNGNWSHLVSTLGKGIHIFTAEAAEGRKPVSSPWAINVAELVLPAPTIIGHTPGIGFDADDAPDTGLITQVLPYIGQSTGDSVRVQLTGAGGSHTTGIQYATVGSTLSFVIPRSIVVANNGQPVTVIYLVASILGGPEVASLPLYMNVLSDTWRDSHGIGGWAFGPAAVRATVTDGIFLALTYGHTGNSGLLLSQAFQLKAARTYRFSYSGRSVNLDNYSLKPVLSVRTSAGQQILNAFTFPLGGTWFPQTSTFRVPSNGTYTLQFISHQDRGGGSGSDGGNDYQISGISVQRL